MIVAQNAQPRNTLTAADIDRIVTESISASGYEPPVNWFQLGRKALRFGKTPTSAWPANMRRGWHFEGGRCEAFSLAQDGTF